MVGGRAAVAVTQLFGARELDPGICNRIVPFGRPLSHFLRKKSGAGNDQPVCDFANSIRFTQRRFPEITQPRIWLVYK